MTAEMPNDSDTNAPQGAAKDHPAMNTVRINLRMAAALRGMTYAEISRKAELSRNVLSQFIAGQKSITYSNLLRICDVLDVPIGILHYPDTITAARIRLHKVLLRTPDHLAIQAMDQAQEWAEGPRKPGLGQS
jgi:transcriptional regulator with XRE-family HTH domain